MGFAQACERDYIGNHRFAIATQRAAAAVPASNMETGSPGSLLRSRSTAFTKDTRESLMSQPAVQRSPQQNGRTRLLIFPREHGAWGMLLIPLITGAGVGLQFGHRLGALALLTVAALALFWMRTPAESLLGTSVVRVQSSVERRTAWLAVVGLGLVAVLALGRLFWGGTDLGLLVIGAGAGLAFLLQAVVKRLGRWGRMPAQFIGAIGLTCTAAAAYYVVAGKFDRYALALWFANWIFAGNQIHYVQVRIHSARASGWKEKFSRARGFCFGQVLMALTLLSTWRIGLLPTLTLVAFIPVLIRGVSWFFRPAKPLNVHRLGLAELSQAIAFGALLIMAARISAL